MIPNTVELVQEYLEFDPNPNEEIRQLQADQKWEQLSELMEPLTFGTAGLRAEMGPGYSRMNNLTVLQASQGLCMHLLATTNIKETGFVIGHDHRHHSLEFARLTAMAFLFHEIPVYFYSKLVHTPLVPFAVTHMGAAGGVMITASHNPGKDNGYKVYGSNGVQIISPADKLIAISISNNKKPWTWDTSKVDTSPLIRDHTEELEREYFKKVSSLSTFSGSLVKPVIKFCYTAMHGVGTPFAAKSFETFGLSPFVKTLEQCDPDPNFPTVEYPNPEEGQGALKLAMKTADEQGAAIILANDPDADRLAVAEKQRDGSWLIFTGNDLGFLFGSFAYQSRIRKGLDTSKIAMVSTVVSYHGLKAMAAYHGFTFAETLTGFKWVGHKALELEKQGYDVVFAFEEAIGFMVGNVVHDKDGVSALAVFAEWANTLLVEKNLLVSEYLESLYQMYGRIVSRNAYVKCHDPIKVKNCFDLIRYGKDKIPSSDRFPFILNYPKTVAGSKVVYIRDLTIGYDSKSINGKPDLPTSASSQMISFELENGTLFTLRTSGTEPKVKYYTEANTTQFLALLVDDILKVLLSPLA